MTRLRARGLSKAFASRGGRGARVEALRDVSFDLPAGRTLAVVGPSGCGKTTLLRTIAGLERPDAGRVLFDERDVTREDVRRRSVGFVFQGLALFDHLDVAANIGYGVRSRGEAKAARVREAAGRARVAALLDARPARLSGGERQRVAFARALAADPAVLLLDEPFSGLDAPLRAELRLDVARARDGGRPTTVLVTHDRADALVLGDLVAVMHDGRIVQLDAPERLLARPATRFVATFLGGSALSVVEGRVEGGRFVAPGLDLDVTCPSGAGAVRAAAVRHDRVRAVPDPRSPARIAAIDRSGDAAMLVVDGPFGTILARPGGADASATPEPRVGDAVRLEVLPGETPLFGPDGARIAP